MQDASRKGAIDGHTRAVDPEALGRAAIREFNERDIDAFAARFTEEAEWLPFRAATEGAYRGPDGVREWLRETDELFDYSKAEIEQIEARGDTVIASGQLQLRGKGS